MSTRAEGLCPLIPLLLACLPLPAQPATWTFAVSGDSRNCGDVVMPAIAAGARKNNAAFYWHLGDYRAIYMIDEDYAHEHNFAPSAKISDTDYLQDAWQDFIDNQLKPFGDLPLYLSLGNHELIPPMTRELALTVFAPWFDAPGIRKQRHDDDQTDNQVHAYYHWLQDGIDFITLDNSGYRFDERQLAWIRALLTRDEESDKIRALVLGMHEALPESLSQGHSMNETLLGTQSGRDVYHWLLDLKRRSNKPVYVLASHSHFYLEEIYKTDYWKNHGGVLPGWIIGTAGAQRYELPPHVEKSEHARSHVYGYLTGAVTDSKDDPVHFTFHEFSKNDLTASAGKQFSSALIDWCWNNNFRAGGE